MHQEYICCDFSICCDSFILSCVAGQNLSDHILFYFGVSRVVARGCWFQHMQLDTTVFSVLRPLPRPRLMHCVSSAQAFPTRDFSRSRRPPGGKLAQPVTDAFLYMSCSPFYTFLCMFCLWQGETSKTTTPACTSCHLLCCCYDRCRKHEKQLFHLNFALLS